MATSMFDRYGGFSSVSKIVMAFYDKVLDSDIIGDYFENTELPALIDHQTKFIASVMGGPASYTNPVLQRVHADLGIDAAAFQEMVSLLRETLEEFELAPHDIDTVIQDIKGRSSYIISA